MYFDVRTVHFV